MLFAAPFSLGFPVVAWGADDAVLNVRTDARYATLSEAAAGAEAGDELKVLRDIVLTETVSVQCSVKLNLNGKTVSYAVPERGAAYTTNVFAFSGGESEVVNGEVVVEGSDPTIPLSQKFTLQGIKVAEGASLALIDVDIDVAFERKKHTTEVTAVTGVAVDEGKISLEGSTSVAVSVSGAYPAEAYGARVGARGALASLNQEPSASIVVENATDREDAGSVSRDASLTSLSLAYLMEVFPEESDAWRQEVADQFALKAKADFPNDSEGSVYDAGLYYVAPLKLADGRYVWAFSGLIAAGDQGRLESIAPARFFGQSYYDRMPVTCGVLVAHADAPNGESEGSAVVKGVVKASSDRGNARAINLSGGHGATVGASAQLEAKGASDPYRSLAGSLTAATLSEKAPSDAAFYPTNKSVAHEVRWTRTHSVCVEGGVAVGEDASLSDEQWGDEPPVLTDLPDIGEIEAAEKPETVTVSLYHWQPLGTQTVYTYTQRALGFGASVTKEAAKLVKPGAVTYHGDKVETFLGWSPRRSDKEPLFTDGLPAATENASYFAIYSQRERRVSVTFMVYGAPYATAENLPAGKTVDAAFKASSNSKRPGPDGAGNLFRGWSLTPGGTPVSHVVKTLAELAQGEEPLTLYAVYYEPVATGGSNTPGSSDQGGKPSGSSKPGSSGNSSKPGASGSAPKPAAASPKGPALPASGLKRPLATAAPARPAAADNAEGEDGAVVLLDEEAGPDGGDGETDLAGAAAGEAPLSDIASGEAIEEGEAPAASLAAANTVGFFGILVALVIAAAWGVFRVVRNRRLDRLEDYYEPELAGGREVCF